MDTIGSVDPEPQQTLQRPNWPSFRRSRRRDRPNVFFRSVLWDLGFRCSYFEKKMFVLDVFVALSFHIFFSSSQHLDAASQEEKRIRASGVVEWRFYAENNQQRRVEPSWLGYRKYEDQWYGYVKINSYINSLCSRDCTRFSKEKI